MGTGRHRRLGRHGLIGLCFVVAWGLGLPGLALEPQRRTSQYNQEIWRSDDGLPQNSVLSGTQTADGYQWFGTHEGLVRFDGARMTVFDRRTSPELKVPAVFSLAEDVEGVLWVGTAQGLFRYEQGQIRRLPDSGVLEEALISSLTADNKALWVSSSEGLIRVPVSDAEPLRHYTVRDGLPDNQVRAAVPDGSGGMWIGTAKGLARMSGDMVQVIPLPGGVSLITELLAARDGTLWIGTHEGLFSLRAGGFTSYGPETGMPRTEVLSLLEDRDGNLWVGTAQGLLRYNASGFSAVTVPKDFTRQSVYSLFEDRDGNVWAGTGSDGVHRLSNEPFIPWGAPEGSSLDNYNLVLEARDGTLWLGDFRDGALERVKDGVVTRMGAQQGLEGEKVRTLAERPDGALWVGTATGAFQYDGARFTRRWPPAGEPDVAILAIVAEPEGGMWLATSLGLVQLRHGRATVHPAPPEMGLPFVMPMVREDSGTIWYGTPEGLVRFERGVFTRFTMQDGLVGNAVMSLYTDGRGTLWVGTLSGLSRLKDGRFTSITTEQGLPDNTAYTLLLDSEGFFWMSHNKGVSRVSRRDLEEVADGRRQRVRGMLFDERDGMRASECNGGPMPSGWKAQDGRLWFTNLRGVVMVDPKDVRLELRPPRVRIEEVRVQGQPVPWAEKLELEPGQQDLEIRFTAFATGGATRVPLRYRLEPFDSGWIDAEGRRSVSYTRLPPGSYRFQVEALARDGQWVEPGAVLEVTLRPWFYQTVWFYLLSVLGVCGVAASVYVWRVGRLKQRERWLQARVQERTKELARANSELDAHLRTLRATQAQLVQAGKMAAVGTLAAGVGHEINNPLSYIVSNLEHSCEEAEELAKMAEGSEPLRERLREMQQVLREALMGADRVRRIVRDLKTFSRQDEDTRGPVELRAVMDSAAKMAAGELKPRAQLVRDYHADVPPVEGNEARLAQVFLNLIINAAQALPEGKPEQNEVRLVLRRGDDGMVVAEVRDTGSGIPPEVLGRIFDPFFTTKPVGVGTGLGLALCHAFVTAMGGRIEVESQVDQGTVFRVTLPAASAPVARSPQAVQERAGGSARGRVLVVDDDPLVSSALRRTLAREHEVEVVVSARQALELLSAPGSSYDVILCDLMMPEITGMDLHAQLQASAPERARRMVFITGGAYTPAAKEFLERVSNPRVEKPFDPEKLREQVREWVKQARAPATGHAA